jgi:hypothetical protein
LEDARPLSNRVSDSITRVLQEERPPLPTSLLTTPNDNKALRRLGTAAQPRTALGLGADLSPG